MDIRVLGCWVGLYNWVNSDMSTKVFRSKIAKRSDRQTLERNTYQRLGRKRKGLLSKDFEKI